MMAFLAKPAAAAAAVLEAELPAATAAALPEAPDEGVRDTDASADAAADAAMEESATSAAASDAGSDEPAAAPDAAGKGHTEPLTESNNVNKWLGTWFARRTGGKPASRSIFDVDPSEPKVKRPRKERSPDEHEAWLMESAAPSKRELAAKAALVTETEGMLLLMAENSFSGYEGVSQSSSSDLTKPFEAWGPVDGKKKKIGVYATALEAAVAYTDAMYAEQEWRIDADDGDGTNGYIRTDFIEEYGKDDGATRWEEAVVIPWAGVRKRRKEHEDLAAAKATAETGGGEEQEAVAEEGAADTESVA